MLNTRPARAVAVIFLLTLVAIATAWGFELIGGYLPCPLCLTQRIAYYVTVPLTGLAMLTMLAGRAPLGLLRAVLVLAGLVMLAGGLLGAYHAGVEWGFWQGPTSCTGSGNLSAGLPDLSKAKVIMCDEVQIRVLGLSFAGWNAVVSMMCVALAIWGLRRPASPA